MKNSVRWWEVEPNNKARYSKSHTNAEFPLSKTRGQKRSSLLRRSAAILIVEFLSYMLSKLYLKACKSYDFRLEEFLLFTNNCFQKVIFASLYVKMIFIGILYNLWKFEMKRTIPQLFLFIEGLFLPYWKECLMTGLWLDLLIS